MVSITAFVPPMSMTLANIAEALNFSESTISRGIADKYLMTPWGIRAFRHFFRNGYKSESGQDISSLTVINHIRQFIKEENPHHPLSDQKIAEMLKNQGFQRLFMVDKVLFKMILNNFLKVYKKTLLLDQRWI